MIITLNTEDLDNIQAMPASPFLAEHKGGGLFIVAQSCTDNSYQAMNLDGRGSCAIGDIYTNMNEAKVRSMFVPLTYSVTLKNDWRAWRQVDSHD